MSFGFVLVLVRVRVRCSKNYLAPSLEIPSAHSAMAFELDSPERESGEDSTTPYGVKGVVGPGSRAQIRLAVEKTECPLQRTTTLLKRNAKLNLCKPKRQIVVKTKMYALFR